MPDDAAAEKAGSAENGDDAIVHGRRGSNFESSSRRRLGRTVHVTCRTCLLTAIHDVDHLVQMRVDLVRQLLEATPLLAELRRFMSRLQESATLPLDVVDDAPPIEAAMRADGDEPRGLMGVNRRRALLRPASRFAAHGDAVMFLSQEVVAPHGNRAEGGASLHPHRGRGRGRAPRRGGVTRRPVSAASRPGGRS